MITYFTMLVRPQIFKNKVKKIMKLLVNELVLILLGWNYETMNSSPPQRASCKRSPSIILPPKHMRVSRTNTLPPTGSRPRRNNSLTVPSTLFFSARGHNNNNKSSSIKHLSSVVDTQVGSIRCHVNPINRW